MSGDAPAGANAGLIDRIVSEIEAARRITFERFMELALYEPELGYYRQPVDRPTDRGDFLTAPETHRLFGWTVSWVVERAWIGLGRPATFTLVEYGAGSGGLGLSIYEGLRRRSSPLADVLSYRPIELNRHRLADLVRRFDSAGLADRVHVSGAGDAGTGDARAGSVAVVSVPADLAPGDRVEAGFVVANEFLDALPVHRVVCRGDRLLERYVTWRDGLVEEEGPPSTPDLAARLEDDGIALAEGQLAEIALGVGPWLDEVAATLVNGYVLIVDYGFPAAELYGPRHRAGTLLGYAGHRVVDDPFALVGQADLTAHVDFTAVRRLAAVAGFVDHGIVTQSQFLVASGLEPELRAFQEDPATKPDDYLRARSGLVRMLDPRAMGGFKVLLLGRGTAAEPL